MSNHIDDFISGNRKDFDDKIPSVKVWENIEAAVSGKKKQKAVIAPIINWVLGAAAVLAIGIFIFVKMNKERPITTETAKTGEINEIVSQYEDASTLNQFAKLISVKQEELKSLSKEQPELYQEFITDINQLDSSYNALQAQLKVSPNKEMLIEAMIQNLQLQLNVLNQQLNIIHQIKQSTIKKV